jgi:hypothetical protein
VPHTGALRVVYAGGISADRGVRSLLARAAALEGVQVTALTTSSSPLPEGVLRPPAVDRGELPEALAQHDVGLVPLDPSRANHAVAAPNKLFDYLAGGLAVVGPPVRELLALAVRRGAGRAVHGGAWSEVLAALRDDRPALETMRRCAHAAALGLDDASQRAELRAIWMRAIAGRR